jgi:hypothetical protein
MAKVLETRASAAYGGVRAGCYQLDFLRFGFAVVVKRRGGFCSNETGKDLGNGEKVCREPLNRFFGGLVKQRF